MKALTAISLAACLAAGCTSIEISSTKSLGGLDVKGANGKADRVVTVSSFGYYFFDRWPLVCSDMRWNEKDDEPAGGIAWFSDQGGITQANELLQKIAEKENCDLCHVICEDTTHSKFDVTSAKGWFSALFNIVEIHTSAVLVPRNEKASNITATPNSNTAKELN